MESLLSFLSSLVSSKAMQPFNHRRDAIHQICECSHVPSSIRGVFTSSTSLLSAASQSGASIRVRGAFYSVLRRSLIPPPPPLHPFFLLLIISHSFFTKWSHQGKSLSRIFVVLQLDNISQRQGLYHWNKNRLTFCRDIVYSQS